MHQMPPKDPADVLRYTRDASAFLGDEAINVVHWSVNGPDDDLVLGTGNRAPSNDDTTATCWLSGGTAGATYVVSSELSTDGIPGRLKKLSFSVTVMER